MAHLSNVMKCIAALYQTIEWGHLLKQPLHHHFGLYITPLTQKG
jgi:hypothetical protein